MLSGGGRLYARNIWCKIIKLSKQSSNKFKLKCLLVKRYISDASVCTCKGLQMSQDIIVWSVIKFLNVLKLILCQILRQFG